VHRDLVCRVLVRRAAGTGFRLPVVDSPRRAKCRLRIADRNQLIPDPTDARVRWRRQQPGAQSSPSLP
jgi:hypothetical protein